jgi:hypothetical protein
VLGFANGLQQYQAKIIYPVSQNVPGDARSIVEIGSEVSEEAQEVLSERDGGVMSYDGEEESYEVVRPKWFGFIFLWGSYQRVAIISSLP